MPGGRCGPHTNQMSRSATTERISHGMKIRRPWLRVSGGRGRRPRRRLGGHQLTTFMLPVMYPIVCMGPPNPSTKPPPQGTRHCQK